MFYILSQVLGWVATVFRAGGMLAKKPLAVKLLVSGGNLLWLVSGAFTSNIPLVVSNGICLIIMVVELIRTRK